VLCESTLEAEGKNVLLNAGNHFSSDSITSQKTGIVENYIFANEIVVICAE
jgi:hypothetical protein